MNINILGDGLTMGGKIVSLSFLKEGESGVVYSFKGGENFKKKLDSLGIRKDKRIKKVSDMVLRGPITIQIENSSRIAIGRGMAEKIMVKVDNR
ncbi:MAG: FeoA family protein [Bacillota bacterium]